MTRSELRKLVGREEFTVRALSERLGISVEAARSRLDRYVSLGWVERMDEVQQYVDERGRPLRGRPSHLYRLV
jgi:predicted ArsR family transcriptional regulator